MDKRQTILIVDDAEFNRELLKGILGECYHYLEAENGNQFQDGGSYRGIGSTASICNQYGIWYGAD